MIVLAETIISLVFEGELSRGRQGQPVSAAIDITHALTDELAVALVHSRYATTGMHAAAGGGLCIYERIGCERYDNVGVEAHYRITPDLVAIGGLHALSFAGDDYGLKLAARGERRIDRFTLRATPTLILAEQWWLPLAAIAHVGPLSGGIETGITAPLDEPSAWEIPIGFTLEVNAYGGVAIGASFVWPRIVGGRDQPANRAAIHGLEHRVAQLWVTSTW